MMPLVGFLEARDLRMRSTIEASERELTSPAGLVYRYKGLDDGLSGSEGTFTICSFWLVEHLILLGEIRKARTLLEKLRGYANDLGLFSEEVDTETGEMLGNFPTPSCPWRLFRARLCCMGPRGTHLRPGGSRATADRRGARARGIVVETTEAFWLVEPVAPCSRG